ncbi:MAG: DUF6148 family protein [Pseudomonadota bacterium]
MSIDLTKAREHLDKWLAADAAAAAGQSYTVTTVNGSRTVTRVNAEEIRKQVAYWERRVHMLESAAAGAGNGVVTYARFNR